MVPTDGGGNNFYRSPLPLGRYLGRDCKHWLGAGPGFGECSPVQDEKQITTTALSGSEAWAVSVSSWEH